MKLLVILRGHSIARVFHMQSRVVVWTKISFIIWEYSSEVLSQGGEYELDGSWRLQTVVQGKKVMGIDGRFLTVLLESTHAYLVRNSLRRNQK
jgi:hypothetical protein